MEAGLAIAVLLATTVAASLIAGYYQSRFNRVQTLLLKSDDLASARGTEIQYLQMQIEVMKGRHR